MSNRVDLTGKRFGKLIADEYIGHGKYRCKCDCGNTVETDAACLRGGKGSCGCIRREKRAQKEIRDLAIKKLRMQKKKNKNTQEKFKLVSEADLINRLKIIKEARQRW